MDAPKMYYCDVCGYHLAWHRRGPHVRGKDHAKMVRTVYAARMAALSDLRGQDFESVVDGHFVVTLKDRREILVDVVAKDDLGNTTVHLVAGGYRQYGDEIVKVEPLRSRKNFYGRGDAA